MILVEHKVYALATAVGVSLKTSAFAVLATGVEAALVIALSAVIIVIH